MISAHTPAMVPAARAFAVNKRSSYDSSRHLMPLPAPPFASCIDGSPETPRTVSPVNPMPTVSPAGNKVSDPASATIHLPTTKLALSAVATCVTSMRWRCQRGSSPTTPLLPLARSASPVLLWLTTTRLTAAAVAACRASVPGASSRASAAASRAAAPAAATWSVKESQAARRKSARGAPPGVACEGAIAPANCSPLSKAPPSTPPAVCPSECCWACACSLSAASGVSSLGPESHPSPARVMVTEGESVPAPRTSLVTTFT